MVARIRGKLGERHNAMVEGMSKAMKVRPGAVLSVLKTHGGDLAPEVVKVKVSELELMHGKSLIGKAIHDELISYGVQQRELDLHLAVLRHIQREPLNDAEQRIAREIHRLLPLWRATTTLNSSEA